LLREKNYKVGNIDSNLVLERPKIAPHIPAMVNCIAEIVGITESCISIKATTNEKMGYVGREEGINASAVVLIYQETV
jgi:2-C-methyl-D-erythritol 2,4-cyclodiphosphate synthase